MEQNKLTTKQLRNLSRELRLKDHRISKVDDVEVATVTKIVDGEYLKFDMEGRHLQPFVYVTNWHCKVKVGSVVRIVRVHVWGSYCFHVVKA